MPHDPHDSGPAILGATWALTALCILVIALRFYVRTNLAQGLKSHDWIMLVALVCISFDQVVAPVWGTNEA